MVNCLLLIALVKSISNRRLLKTLINDICYNFNTVRTCSESLRCHKRHLRGEAFSHATGVIFISNNVEQNKRKVPTGTLPCQNDTKMARFLPSFPSWILTKFK